MRPLPKPTPNAARPLRAAYVANDPINATDPTGEFAWTSGIEIRGMIAGYGGSLTIKGAQSVSVQDGKVKYQSGVLGGRGFSMVGPSNSADDSRSLPGRILGAIIAGVMDTGISLDIDAGAT